MVSQEVLKTELTCFGLQMQMPFTTAGTQYVV
jgi:hypothetical protein